jgi:hypothetical protein
MLEMKKYPLLLVLAASSTAYAEGNQTGTINWIATRASDGVVYFTLGQNPKTGSPGCATSSYWTIADETSTTGKQQIAQLMLAAASGTAVSVSGSGGCGLRMTNAENVNQILNNVN